MKNNVLKEDEEKEVVSGQMKIMKYIYIRSFFFLHFTSS